MEHLSMSESGVDLDFDQLLEADEHIGSDSFYNLISQPVVFESTKPEVKNVSATKSRTQLRQQLQRQADFVQQQQKKDQTTIPTPTLLGATTAVSSAISAAPSTTSAAVQIAAAASINSELPPQVLKVRPLLEHPTRHHVKQTQKRQVQEFLSGQLSQTRGAGGPGGPAGGAVSTQSLPSVIAAANNSLNMGVSGAAYLTGGTSLPVVDPDSPLSVGFSSTATSVDDIDLIGDIISCESFDTSMDNELHQIDSTLAQVAHTMPHSTTAFLDHGYDIATSPQLHDNASSSCPPGIGDAGAAPTKHHGGRQRQGQPPPYLTPEEVKQWYRERQKKDSHNQIEKRRRLTINDKIKELGEILPRSAHDGGLYSDLRQNKGSILKASVDYIYKLKRDQEKLKQMEERQKQMENMNRKMLLKMQEMEMLMQAHGITSSPSAQTSTSTQMMSSVLQQSSPSLADVLKQEPGHPSPLTASGPELMDDSPVQGDPMMSSVIPNGHSQTISVEDISDLLS